MIETYKIIKGIYDIEIAEFFTINEQSVTRANSCKIAKPLIRTSIKKNSFSFRIINNWNSLSNEIVTAPSLNSFKNRLNKHWNNHPLKYLSPM